MYEIGNRQLLFNAHATQARLNSEDRSRATVLRVVQRRKRTTRT
jgi:hypothetical protein